MKNLFVLLFTFGSLMLSAQDKDQLFAEANKAYNDGNYQQAITTYEQILQGNQQSAAVYFNLANAHYKSSHIAPSIFYYEKALLLTPNDTDIQNNLSFAQNMTIDAIEQLPTNELSRAKNRWLSFFSIDQWAYISITATILFVLLFLLYYRSTLPTQKRIAFISSLAIISIGILAVSMSFILESKERENRPAILFKNEVSVQSEPNLRSESAFRLHEGTKFYILDQFDIWKKIQLDNGQTGWVLAEDLREIKTELYLQTP
ncbi:MAG: tetratricopeptide repeat protein [Flavobacteriaceae bacterium]|nr:tetratricopeptide repeat protein [Flavobacteriaceae bacterium]